MKLFRPRLAHLVAIASAVSLFGAAGATTALATGETCTFGSSSGNTLTCMTVVGSGLHIDRAIASATVEHSARTLDVELSGPTIVIDSGFVLVQPGQTLSVTWSPNANEPAGNYCATTFRLNSDGTVTQIGHTCVGVHS
jgi:hypothetical protein